jgi:hypothetical protein
MFYSRRVFEKVKRLFFVLVVLALPITILWGGCSGGTRKGSIQPVLKDEELSFEIDYGSSNGLLGLTITDTSTGKAVWDVKLSYFSGADLTYGEVPQNFETFNGATNSAKQRIPETGDPPKLAEGNIYRIYSDWQYDRFGAATAAGQTQYFEIRNDNIVFVENPNPTQPPKKPSDR